MYQMFETILVKRFEHLPGKDKVVRKEYAIEESRSGRELTRNREWSMCFRAGQKVDMSMVFKQKQPATTCPGCQAETQAADAAIIQW
jgi:hypothetical protein